MIKAPGLPSGTRGKLDLPQVGIIESQRREKRVEWCATWQRSVEGEPGVCRTESQRFTVESKALKPLLGGMLKFTGKSCATESLGQLEALPQHGLPSHPTFIPAQYVHYKYSINYALQ